MKQSTKLLSLLLALIMAFSCMSVIGSAAATVEKGTMQYDSIDDADPCQKIYEIFIHIFLLQ